MPITLTRPSGYQVRLFNGREDRRERQTSVQTTAAPGQAPDEALLTALEQEGRATITGTATAPRLARQPQYSNDALDALAHYLLRLEKVCNGNQGSDGVTVDSPVRDSNINTLVTGVEWQWSSDAQYEAEYTLSLVQASGVGQAGISEPATPTFGTTALLDGVTLPNVSTVRVERTEPLNVYALALAENPGENKAVPTSGVQRRIIIEGDATGSDTTLSALESDLQDRVGGDQTVALTVPVTGRTQQGALELVSPTRSASAPGQSSYEVEFVQGATLEGEDVGDDDDGGGGGP
jgi:hypothetical protein